MENKIHVPNHQPDDGVLLGFPRYYPAPPAPPGKKPRHFGLNCGGGAIFRFLRISEGLSQAQDGSRLSFDAFFFPTCQVRVVRNFVRFNHSCSPPPPPPPHPPPPSPPPPSPPASPPPPLHPLPCPLPPCQLFPNFRMQWAYLVAFYLAYLLAFLSGISSGILSDMLSGVLSGISSGIFWHSIWPLRSSGARMFAR